MTDAQLKELDDKRKKREDELLLLLLLLLGWSVERALAEGGGDGIPGREDTGSGRPAALRIVEQVLREHGVREIAETMADAHLDASRIYEPSTVSLPSKEVLTTDYADIAGDMTSAMVESIAKHLATTNDLAEALALAGYTKSSIRNLETGVERNVVTASNAGLFNGAVVRFGIGGITGLKHRSVLDARTSKQCQERDGLQLPASDAYWLLNWPSLHSGCRSAIEVLTKPFRVSQWRPRTPPDVGYGKMPATVRRLLKRLKAA